MLDAAAVHAALDGSGWTVVVEADPNVLQYDEHGEATANLVRDVDGTVIDTNPGRIRATKDVAELMFSPSHSVDELVAALREHDALEAHGSGAHDLPVFGCPACLEATR